MADPIPNMRGRRPIPTTARSVAKPTEVQKGNMLGSKLTMEQPAQAGLTAIATRRQGKAAMLNGLGTTRPSFVYPGISADKTYVFLIPVAKETPGAVEVRYEDGRARFNLYDMFSELDRLVPVGIREYYEADLTTQKVKIEEVDVEGYGLAVDLLQEVKTSPIKEKGTKRKQPPATGDSTAE